MEPVDYRRARSPTRPGQDFALPRKNNEQQLCRHEERSDVVIHLEYVLDCRSRKASFAMTNRKFIGAVP